MTLVPGVQCVPAGSVVNIELVLSSDQAIQVGAIDALLQWDPLALEFVQSLALGGQWLVGAFLPDPDGINLSLTDGQALYTLLANPANPPGFPPSAPVVRFRFRVLGTGTLSIVPSAGQFAKTRVLGVTPGVDWTGDLGGPANVGTVFGASSQTVRSGSPPNPLALLPDPLAGPRVGQVWQPRIDHSLFQTGAIIDGLLIAQAPTNILLVPYGTLLLLPPELIPGITSAPGVPFSIPIPPKCGLVGLPLATQGYSIDGGFNLALTNALDLVLGSS